MGKTNTEDNQHSLMPLHDAIIIGAGMSGICAAIKLRQAGFTDILILERSQGVGGTWHDNVYPGSGCDVPSHLYSYSFALNPEWTHVFSGQEEILKYFEKCVDDFGIRRFLRTGVDIISAVFEETSGAWQVQSKDGNIWRARFLIMGVGQLNRPKIPQITGLQDFNGPQFHSARWDHGITMRGKRIAVIGTGASAVQFVPELVRQGADVDIFQRSPNWVIRRNDHPYKSWQKGMFHHFPSLMRAYRSWIYMQLEARFAGFHKGALIGKLIRAQALKHLRSEITDPQLREKLTPDFPVGCKRILISDDYYPALNNPGTTLHTAPITQIESQGIRTNEGGFHPADVLIFGTGFEATHFLSPIAVQGRAGLELNEIWRGGAEAHNGVCVAGFPNMFLLYGPNTNLGHNSIIFMVERQVEYIVHLLKAIKSRQALYIEVRADAMQHYNSEIQEALKSSVWSADCGSWYKTKNGKITNNWPSWTIAYWWKIRRPDIDEFEFA